MSQSSPRHLPELSEGLLGVTERGMAKVLPDARHHKRVFVVFLFVWTRADQGTREPDRSWVISPTLFASSPH